MGYITVRYKNDDELTHYGVKGMKWRNHRRSQHGIFDQRKQNVLAAGAAAKQKLHQQENGRLSTKAKRFAESWKEARDEDVKTVGDEIKDRKKKIKEALKPHYKVKITTGSQKKKDNGFVSDGNGNHYKKSGNSSIKWTSTNSTGNAGIPTEAARAKQQRRKKR